ncbi:unnamed protein product [Closterium sp. Naga37s-1]|nr:unnamed protein product [Closterium sp. Naga37s-1]
MVRRSHGDAYALLGVSHDASLAQVKAAYRRLALKLREEEAKSRKGDEEKDGEERSSGSLSNHRQSSTTRGTSSGTSSSVGGGSGSGSGSGVPSLDGLGFGRGPIGAAISHALTSNSSRTSEIQEEGIQRQSGSDGSAGSSDRRSSTSWWSSMGGGSRGGPRGPSRVVEPTADEEKRQRIARILLERARKAQEDGAEEEVR